MGDFTSKQFCKGQYNTIALLCPTKQGGRRRQASSNNGHSTRGPSKAAPGSSAAIPSPSLLFCARCSRYRNSCFSSSNTGQLLCTSSSDDDRIKTKLRQ
ncbi:hypothetical protein MUK42_08184 [Musa troglodytarum]|uniref:Uncharacterized protein n=1 Tax=Musa troglodytarum TaxID=320322 RepID=A0A9E7FIZ7_9LILI|nr:hypothetical protein MUK42_08184 [Musa troglodytarum]